MAGLNSAWMLLKNQVRRGHRGLASNPRVPMTEDAYSDRPYGNISYRESPLHGLEDDDEGTDDSGSMPPMGRTLSEPPRMPPVGSDDLHPDDLADMTDEEIQAYTNKVEARGPFNPFPLPDRTGEFNFDKDIEQAKQRRNQQALQDRIDNRSLKSLDAAWMLLKNKPLAGRVQDQLAEFADTDGRRVAMSPQPDYSKHENSTDLYHDSFDENDDFNPINSVPTDAHPEAHNIASTNLRQTPRKQKRGKMDSGQAFKRPGFRGPAMPLPGGKGD